MIAPAPSLARVLAALALATLAGGCFDNLSDLQEAGGESGRDTSFGLPVVAVSPQDDQANAVAVGADGSVLLAGEATIDHAGRIDTDATLVKLTAGGALDASFGTGGIVTLEVGAGNDEALAVAVDAAGRILLAGFGRNGANDDLFVARFTPAGALDASFGAGGRRVIDVAADNDRATGIALSGSTIYVVGRTENGNATTRDILVVALDGSGAPLASFDGDGRRTLGSAGVEEGGTAIVALPGGDVAVAGFAVSAGNTSMVLGRLTASGAAASGFGTAGLVGLDLGPSADAATAIALDAGGGLLVLAEITPVGGADPTELLLARFQGASGAVDTAFGVAGGLRTGFGADLLEAEGLTVHPSGRIFVSGTRTSGGDDELYLAAINATGALDASYGSGGTIRLQIPGRKTKGHGCALSPSARGEVVVAAEAESAAGDDDHAALRFFAE